MECKSLLVHLKGFLHQRGRNWVNHTMLDGQKVDRDKAFSNGCMFPGDPNGAPAEVYNCRCALIAAVDGVDTSDAERWARDPETGRPVLVRDMTYKEWEAYQRSINNTAWERYQKMGKNRSADMKQFEEYKSLMKSNVPDSFSEFQKLKYTNSIEWNDLKNLYKYYKQGGEPLTPTELDAIRNYTGGAFAGINGILRGTRDISDMLPDDANMYYSWIKKLDGYLGRATIKEDITLYRGIGDRVEALSKLLGLQSDDLDAILKKNPQALIGQKITDAAYLSTSKSSEISLYRAKKFKLVLEVPAGTKGSDISVISSNPTEGETLLHRKTVSKISKVSAEQNGDITIFAKVVSQDFDDSTLAELKENIPNE